MQLGAGLSNTQEEKILQECGGVLGLRIYNCESVQELDCQHRYSAIVLEERDGSFINRPQSLIWVTAVRVAGKELHVYMTSRRYFVDSHLADVAKATLGQQI
ncbi:hypothetical protein AMECASPLE_028354 [Ameca splendens]|uniref:Uncharacterized protein n=1 Tax=Ameca splendens TaxID=208324 RepID=A0ABV0Y5Q9_9TELE